MKKPGLSGTALKVLALVFMTVDHVGLVFFPSQVLFRQIGRLAFPVFAYMIGEGCRHTRNILRYFLTTGAVALVCQIAYFAAMDSLYQCVLVTFSLSIGLTALVRQAQKQSSWRWWLFAVLGFGVVFFFTEILPKKLPGTDFQIDYGFWGVVLPVAVYLGRDKWEKLLFAGICLAFLAMVSGETQWYALLSLPLLALYNGTRGKGLGKYFFYIYYPLHLLAIQGLSYLLS